MAVRSGKTLIDLLQACRRSKFLYFSLDRTVIRDLRLTPVGKLLFDNLCTEWSSSSSVPILMGQSNLSLKENIAYVQERNKPPKLPFGVMVEEKGINKSVPMGNTFTLELPETVEHCTTYLLPASIGSQFLYQLQRQRKIWWMRLSVDPGRFFISDMRRYDEDGGISVSICARFLERSEHNTELELEQLELSLMNSDDDDNDERTSNRTVVRVSSNLNRALFAILMDALERNEPLEPSVKIHRKIAPFKCGIVCRIEDQYRKDDVGLQQDLSDLSKHLTYVLRAAKLSVHDDDDGSFGQLPCEHKVAQLDQIGTPYALLLNAKTLQTGLLQLRSRDTTLSETIHVSDLPSYLVKIIHA